MRSLVAFFTALTLCQARPQLSSDGAPRPSFTMGGEQYIIGGSDAEPGEFPWQLSVQHQSPEWSHSFSATLLSANYGLSPAHVVDGALPRSIRVVAGLHRQSDPTGVQIVDVASIVIHENYGVGTASFANDISILVFETPLTIGGNVQPATLPADNTNTFAGYTCVITEWDGTAVGVLQKAPIEVISTSQCNNMLAGVGGANIWDNQICVYDEDQIVSACGGDSGGPLNCPDGVTRVAGVSSWVVSSGGGSCLSSYPSIYTRTSAYLQWIAANTP